MSAPLQEWSIGIYTGSSPVVMATPAHIKNPVLTYQEVSDVPAVFVADPFMLRVDHTWYMFFEVMNRQTKQGEIGLAISNDGLRWHYQQVVLRESFHLSYPYVFTWQGAYYMIPESYQAGAIRLYQARSFPYAWRCVATLLHGPYFADASLCRYKERWWLFTDASPTMTHDTLRLYYADDLRGPWSEHPASPIIAHNPHTARPAGRLIVSNGRVIRYTQDCSPVYGTQVRGFEITTLTTTRYHERAVSQTPVLVGSGTGWNASGMHHIDAHQLENGQWLACVDGFRWRESAE